VTLEILFVALGAFVGGFVNGLTGFGLALTAHAFWLHVIGPTLAAPLATVCAVMSQMQTLPRIWRDLNVCMLDARSCCVQTEVVARRSSEPECLKKPTLLSLS